MKTFHYLAFLLVAVFFIACQNTQQQNAANPSESKCDNPYTLEKMHLKGPVKMMVKSVYDANIWSDTYYYFAPDGHLDSIAQEITSYGDRMTLAFDDCGRVVDTSFFIQYGDADGVDPVDVDMNPTLGFASSLVKDRGPLPEGTHTHQSELVDGISLENDLNDMGYVTRFKGDGEGKTLIVDFSYEEDGKTPSYVHYVYSDEGQTEEDAFETKQYDENGNPILWPVNAPYGGLSLDMFYMWDEFLTGLYVERFTYEYYK